MNVSFCRSCQAAIEWGITDNGRRIPLDVGTWPDGRLVIAGRLDGSQLLVSLTGDQLARLRESEAELELRRAHFQTCPQADTWRQS